MSFYESFLSIKLQDLFIVIDKTTMKTMRVQDLLMIVSKLYFKFKGYLPDFAFNIASIPPEIIRKS